MTQWIGKTQIWFAALSLREKILVAIGAMLAMAVVGVYGIALPLLAAINGKQADYFSALERRAAIILKVDAALANKPGVAATPAGEMRELVLQSALDAGFALDGVTAQGNNAASFSMLKARPAAFMAWLDEWEMRGIMVKALDIKAGTDGTVAVNATFVRQQAS
jgi:general secretion pathway protein M